MEGAFAKGDVVQIVDEYGETFARGFVNYDEASLRQIVGLQTVEIPTVLGGNHSGEVIHRDNLVLS